MKILSAVAVIILFVFGATAQTTNDLSDAEIQGRNLARQLCDSQPAENFTNKGMLEIRSKGITTNFPIDFQAIISKTNWQYVYSVSFAHGFDSKSNFFSGGESITVIHSILEPNQYIYQQWANIQFYTRGRPGVVIGPHGSNNLLGDQTFIWFGQSDFWICDLGLEFFHWPEQKILKRENSRGRVCKVLESTNSNPSPDGYSRVDSWIDEETLGIVQAYAYDAQGKKLKEFYPKDFKKVDGQWQVGMMEMDNVQTGSRSRIEFDLKSEGQK
jgi:hypothetical protein